MNKSSPESPAKEQPGEVAKMVKRLKELEAYATSSDAPEDAATLRDAAALLEKLGQEWISVEERLPEVHEDVWAWIVYSTGSQRGSESWVDEDGVWALSGHQEEVTHWQPLPPPPERP